MGLEKFHARPVASALLFAASALALAPPARAQEPASAPDVAPGWTSVSLIARKGPLKATVDLSVTRVAVGEVIADLATCPESDCRKPSDQQMIVLDATTDAPFSAPLRSRAWFDPVHGALQVESWQGKKHRRYRECVSGRHAWRWEREGGCDVLVAERRSEGPAGGSAVPVVDATSLLWLASSGRLDREGSSMKAAAWSKGRLVVVELAARERELLPLRRDPKRSAIAARRVEISAADEEDDDDESSSPAPFGLRGPVSLWLEEGTGLPLVLEGKSAKIGRIRAVNVASGVR